MDGQLKFKITLLIVKLFGEREVGFDISPKENRITTITSYRFRDKVYVTNLQSETIIDADPNT